MAFEPNSLASNIWAAAEGNIFNDIQISCSDGVIIGANSTLLMMRSQVFLTVLSGPTIEAISRRITLRDIESILFKKILKYIYTDTISFDNGINDVEAVYRAADFLDLPGLKNLALNQVEHISDIGALRTYLIELKCSCTSEDNDDSLTEFRRNISEDDCNYELTNAIFNRWSR